MEGSAVWKGYKDGMIMSVVSVHGSSAFPLQSLHQRFDTSESGFGWRTRRQRRDMSLSKSKRDIASIRGEPHPDKFVSAPQPAIKDVVLHRITFLRRRRYTHQRSAEIIYHRIDLLFRIRGARTCRNLSVVRDSGRDDVWGSRRVDGRWNGLDDPDFCKTVAVLRLVELGTVEGGSNG